MAASPEGCGGFAGGLCLLSAANLLTQHSPRTQRRAKGSSAAGLVPVSCGPRAVAQRQGLRAARWCLEKAWHPLAGHGLAVLGPLWLAVPCRLRQRFLGRRQSLTLRRTLGTERSSARAPRSRSVAGLLRSKFVNRASVHLRDLNQTCSQVCCGSGFFNMMI